ncbi:MAG: hypothetical protein KGI11_09735 [Thaumarchaeota archaeon]|nr:hypothetical protein [Nitrososphaerota archaeon]
MQSGFGRSGMRLLVKSGCPNTREAFWLSTNENASCNGKMASTNADNTSKEIVFNLVMDGTNMI